MVRLRLRWPPSSQLESATRMTQPPDCSGSPVARSILEFHLASRLNYSRKAARALFVVVSFRTHSEFDPNVAPACCPLAGGLVGSHFIPMPSLARGRPKHNDTGTSGAK